MKLFSTGEYNLCHALQAMPLVPFVPPSAGRDPIVLSSFQVLCRGSGCECRLGLRPMRLAVGCAFSARFCPAGLLGDPCEGDFPVSAHGSVD